MGKALVEEEICRVIESASWPFSNLAIA